MSRKNKNTYKYKRKKISIKEHNKQKCDANCLFFPNYIDKDVEFEYCKGVKYRTNKVPYICAYDGHVIYHFCSDCKHKKIFSDYRRTKNVNKR